MKETLLLADGQYFRHKNTWENYWPSFEKRTVPMETKEYNNLRKQLEDEKARLELELQGVTGGKKDASEATIDAEFPEFGSKDDENAAEVATFSDKLSLEGKLEEALKDVNKALDRMENGTYGICKYCGNEIPLKRLEARPASSACIACKEALKAS